MYAYILYIAHTYTQTRSHPHVSAFIVMYNTCIQRLNVNDCCICLFRCVNLNLKSLPSYMGLQISFSYGRPYVTMWICVAPR